ncbi:Arc family DNA-binding protein [Pseudomonas aeruginosa]|nr:Arc family DNA-binding protein [Pseudomonas aeruginosa]
MIAVNEVTNEVLTMAILTVRNVPDEVHRALRLRAAEHGRSTEAEVREILESAVKSEKRIRMGDALAELGRRVGLTNEDFAVLDQVRDKVPAEPMRFE